MATWIVSRSHVSATDLGTNDPWIPKQLFVTAHYFSHNNEFLEFKNVTNEIVYTIRKDMVREVQLLGGPRPDECPEMSWVSEVLYQ